MLSAEKQPNDPCYFSAAAMLPANRGDRDAIRKGTVLTDYALSVRFYARGMMVSLLSR